MSKYVKRAVNEDGKVLGIGRYNAKIRNLELSDLDDFELNDLMIVIKFCHEDCREDHNEFKTRAAELILERHRTEVSPFSIAVAILVISDPPDDLWTELESRPDDDKKLEALAHICQDITGSIEDVKGKVIEYKCSPLALRAARYIIKHFPTIKGLTVIVHCMPDLVDEVWDRFIAFNPRSELLKDLIEWQRNTHVIDLLNNWHKKFYGYEIRSLNRYGR